MKRMQKTSVFSVQSRRHNQANPTCQLLVEGHPTGKTLKGSKLVDQFVAGKRYVVITDDDNFFEEVLHIYLLDLELNVLDELDFSQPFTAGIYRLHRHDESQICFQFFDDGLWSLRVRQEPRPSPFNYSSFPTRRPIKLWGRQYLSLYKAEMSAA